PLEDVKSVEVTIDSISLYGGAASPVEITDEPTTVDLMTLIGEEISLGTVEGTATYTQLRMEISDATLTTIEDEVFEVKVASGSLKIGNLDIEFKEGEETTLMLDFDLSKSLIVTGPWPPKDNPIEPQIIMTPYIGVRYGRLYDVTGVATPTMEASPYLVALIPEDATNVLTTFTHKENPVWEQGEFRFCKVEPGEYTLQIYDNYTEEGFDTLTSTPLYTYPEDIVVENSDVDLGTMVVKEEEEEEEETGKLNVYMTDAVLPLEDVKSVEVTIDSISLYGGAASPVEITYDPTTVDLMTLIGEEISLGTVEGTATYTQLRMEISDATLTTMEDEIYEVKVASGSLKISNLDIEFDNEQGTTLMLDFDLSKSLKVNGQWPPEDKGKGNKETQIIMTPTIGVRHGELYDITGVATPTMEASPYLVALLPEDTEDSTKVLTTFTHKENPKWEQGEFRFCKVEPGEYTLQIYDNYTEESFDPLKSEAFYTHPEEIEVEDGDVDLGTIVID
ncbi:MAG: DUF4382 domain-containing protein, partial [Kosmotogaceae bacterium]